ncbi:MAG TPA: YrhB domain-containing protein [Polyangiaceae bacterium]
MRERVANWAPDESRGFHCSRCRSSPQSRTEVALDGLQEMDIMRTHRGCAMDFKAARAAVLKHVNTLMTRPDDELVIIDSSTRTKPYGWIFFYNSKRYLETKDMMYALGGNGPIVFERDTGAIIPLATHNTADKLIRAYELTRG